MEKKEKALLLKKAEKSYKDAIRIFACMHSESEKAELLKKMVKRTVIVDWLRLNDYIFTISMVGAAASLNMGIQNQRPLHFIYATSLLVIGGASILIRKKTESLGKGNIGRLKLYERWPISHIVISHKFGTVDAFGAAVQFMQGEKIIKPSNSNAIALAAEIVYSNRNKKKLNDSLEYSLDELNCPDARILADRAIACIGTNGEQAAWDCLYKEAITEQNKSI